MTDLLDKINFNKKNVWLVTGASGFIGSNLVNFLLKKNQKIIGIDNFSNSKKKNINKIKRENKKKINNLKFINKDLLNVNYNLKIFKKIDYVVHLAALGSVPRSFEQTLLSSRNNLDIYIRLLDFIKDKKIKRLIVTSSSSIYGNSKSKLKNENLKYDPLSPYAVSKTAIEFYSKIYAKNFNIPIIVFRIFNVFGPYQQTENQYSAVIPKWIKLYIKNKKIYIYGKKTISRDFTYVDNILYAIFLVSKINKNLKKFDIFNIACGKKISLGSIISLIKKYSSRKLPQNIIKINYTTQRKGDIETSLANINKSKKNLKYFPIVQFEKGLKKTIKWIIDNKW